MKQSAIAAVIQRDLLRVDNADAKTDVVACRSCGYTFRYRGRRGELNGNFCSARCQDWFDAGNSGVDQDWRGHATMQRGRYGYFICCAHCAKEFESLGLRCCSDECERGYREREDNLAVMAEVGIEPAGKRRCANPDCEATIPKWRNGRKVSSATRFCSPKCGQRYRTAQAA